jgi:putative transposase
MAIAESYIQSVSTGKMEELVKSFGLNRLSASEVSRLCKILDEKVEEFFKRPIDVKIRYLMVDATYFKMRCGAQYKNRAMLVVVGIREDGLREILGASIAESKDSGYWMTLFRSLKDRGLEGVELVISDAQGNSKSRGIFVCGSLLAVLPCPPFQGGPGEHSQQG